uniref:Mucin-5AC-like n=1 Tax=Strongyloides venezuelensis TaxID=75913 RepID=A0A0K0EYS8_STRVS
MLIPKAGSVIAAVLLLFPSGLTALPQRDVSATGGALVVGNLVKEGGTLEAGLGGVGGLAIKAQERRRPSPGEPSSTMYPEETTLPTDSSSTEMPPSSTESEGTETPSSEMASTSTESDMAPQTVDTESQLTEMNTSSGESKMNSETEGMESQSSDMNTGSGESKMNSETEGMESQSSDMNTSSGEPKMDSETEGMESQSSDMNTGSGESKMNSETEGMESQSSEKVSSSTESEMTPETESQPTVMLVASDEPKATLETEESKSPSTDKPSGSTESEDVTSETEREKSSSVEMSSNSAESEVTLGTTEGTESPSTEMPSNSTETEMTHEADVAVSQTTEMPSNSARSEPKMVSERPARNVGNGRNSGSLKSLQNVARCNETYEDFVTQRQRCRMVRWRDDECIEFRLHYGDLADEDDDYDDDDYFDFWKRQVILCGRDSARESVAGLTIKQGSTGNTVSEKNAPVVVQADARCNDTYEEFVAQRHICRTLRWRSEECLEFRLHYGDLADEDDDFDDDDYTDFWKRQVILCNKRNDGKDVVAELMKKHPKFMSSRPGRFFTRSAIDGEDAAMNETSTEKPMEGGDVVGDATNSTNNSSPSKGENGITGETTSNTTSTDDMESMKSMNVTTSSENVNCTVDPNAVNGTICENTNSTCRLQERCYSDSDCGGGKCIGLFAGTCNCSACHNFKPCLSDEGCGGLTGACDMRTRRCNCQAAFNSLGYKTPIGFFAKFCFNQFCDATSDTCHGLPCVFGRCFC